MDPKMKEKTDRRVTLAKLRGADSDKLLDIICLQADRITELEDHMEWVFGKLEKLNNFAGLSTE